MYNRIYNFLTNCNQLYRSQYGFRSNHSCEQAISELLGAVLKGQEKNENTVAVFLDLSKAFDTLDHSILFNKLELYGIRGTPLTWLKSYLNNCMMCVKCNAGSNGLSSTSDWQSVEYGTPPRDQILVLYCLLFFAMMSIYNWNTATVYCLLMIIQYTNCIKTSTILNIVWKAI